jgi:hypothetical protein
VGKYKWYSRGPSASDLTDSFDPSEVEWLSKGGLGQYGGESCPRRSRFLIASSIAKFCRPSKLRGRRLLLGEDMSPIDRPWSIGDEAIAGECILSCACRPVSRGKRYTKVSPLSTHNSGIYVEVSNRYNVPNQNLIPCRY